MKTLKKIIVAGLITGLIMVNTLPTNPLRSEASASDFGELSRTESVNPSRNNADLTKVSNGIKVAILDSGSNTVFKEGISLIDGTVKDYNGHGTLMARIIKEVKPDAELYIIKVMGKDGLAVNEDAVILGLEWAISRDVDVINMSLRLKGSARLHQVIKRAYDKGIVIVAAAGNTTSRMGTLNTHHSSRNLTAVRQVTQFEVAYPAKYREVIAVGALDKYGRVYDGSIEGEEVDVHIKGYKGRKAGTSIASAYAAGLAAKIISENPNINIQEVKNIMSQQGGELR